MLKVCFDSEILIFHIIISYILLGTIKHVKNAVIAVFGGPLEPSKSETKGTVLLTTADDLLNFSKGEEQLMDEVCDLYFL